MKDRDRLFHEKWLGYAEPIEGLVFSAPGPDGERADRIRSAEAFFREFLGYAEPGMRWAQSCRVHVAVAVAVYDHDHVDVDVHGTIHGPSKPPSRTLTWTLTLTLTLTATATATNRRQGHTAAAGGSA